MDAPVRDRVGTNKTGELASVGDFRNDFIAEAKRIRMKTDICYAFGAITGKPPYEYQEQYLKDNSRLNVVNKSRQTGFTFAAAFKRFWRGWTGKTNSDTEIIISVSQRASDTVMRYIKSFCYKVGVNEKLGTSVWNANQITFDSGVSVFTLPQSPSTIRSLHGNVLLDEAAHFEKGKEIKEAVMPFLSRGYGMDAISTPRGCDEFFYQTFWENTHFNHYNVPWHSCPDLTQENLEPIWATMDEDSRRQEYECEFLDESIAYFPYSLIMSCVDSELEVGEMPLVRQKGTGIDIGRVKDATEVVGIMNDGAVGMIRTMKGVKFEDQLVAIRPILAMTNRACIDSTGIGMMMAEKLQSEFGSVIEPCTFTQDLKEQWATQVRVALEKGVPQSDGSYVKLKLPNNRDLINQIHSMKRIPTSTGVRFDVEKNDKHHGDKFWALALGWHAAFGAPKGSMEVIQNTDLDELLSGRPPSEDDSGFSVIQRSRERAARERMKAMEGRQ